MTIRLSSFRKILIEIMKHRIIRFLQLLFSNPKFFLKFKDTALCNPAEHLYRTVQYIRTHQLENSGAYILDIGVADGATCNFFSKEFPAHQVIGFEPVKTSFDHASAQTKQQANISLRHMALSDRRGETTVNITSDSLSSSLNEIDYGTLDTESKAYSSKFETIERQPVTMSTLDHEIKDQKILLIKIDTQGTELTILKGGIETLKRTKLILIEMNNHQLYKNSCQYYEVDEFLRQQGFALKDIYVTYRDKGYMKEYDALYINTLA